MADVAVLALAVWCVALLAAVHPSRTPPPARLAHRVRRRPRLAYAGALAIACAAAIVASVRHGGETGALVALAALTTAASGFVPLAAVAPRIAWRAAALAPAISVGAILVEVARG